MALEVQRSLGESSDIFITRLCRMLCRSHDDQRAGSFLKQRISMDLQIGNAAGVLGTVRCVRGNFFQKSYFLNLYIIAALKKFHWSTVIVAGMGLPTFVANHGCVSSPPDMMIHMALYYTCDKQVFWESVGAFFSARQHSFQPASSIVHAFVV